MSERLLAHIPEAGGRIPEAGGRIPEAGGRIPEAGGRIPEAGGRIPEAALTPQMQNISILINKNLAQNEVM